MPCCSKKRKFQRIPGELSSDDDYYDKDNGEVRINYENEIIANLTYIAIITKL